MRVRMLRTTGGPDNSVCHLGEVYDLPEGLASQWVTAGRAVRAEDPEAGIVVETRDPVVQTASTPSRKRR